MKKVLIFLGIIIISVCVGFGWTYMEDCITEITHPLKYSEYVDRYSEEYGVPREILYAVIKCESSFEADAQSKSGAVGLMQIMPSTYEELCRRKGEEYNASLLYAPEINIEYGAFYLSYLHSKYGVWETVFAAYNAGYGNVDNWLKSSEISEDGRLKNIPFEETRDYVRRVSDARNVYSEILEKNNRKVESVISNIAQQ